MQRKFWRRLLKIIAIVLLLWLIFVAGLIITIHMAGQQQNAQVVDVIIVLGAGLDWDGSANDASRRRSKLAAELWHDGYGDMIICAGGYTQTPTRSEADGCRDVLLGEGVSPDAIVLENQSRSTEENAFYSWQIMQANKWQTAMIVSDSFHMFRARWIFTSQGHDVLIYSVPSTLLAPYEYTYQIGREVLALHWQAFKETLDLPITYVP